jgi:hypothetical protein
MNVFLSYSHHDRDLAHALAKRLRAAGFQVWDPGTEILPGDNWASELGKALDDADAMVVLVSPEALASDWMQHEIEFALGSQRLKGRLVPVVVRPTPDLPWIFKKLQVVEVTEELSSVGDSVVEALERAA